MLELPSADSAYQQPDEQRNPNSFLNETVWEWNCHSGQFHSLFVALGLRIPGVCRETTRLPRQTSCGKHRNKERIFGSGQSFLALHAIASPRIADFSCYSKIVQRGKRAFGCTWGTGSALPKTLAWYHVGVSNKKSA